MSNAETLNAPHLLRERTGRGRLVFVQVAVAVGVLIGCSYGTQWFARLFAYNPVLGWNWNHWYLPWDVFLWWNKYRNYYPKEVAEATQRVLWVAFPIIGASFYFALRVWSQPTVTEGLHGTARWAQLREMRAVGLLPKVELTALELLWKDLGESVRLIMALGVGLSAEIGVGLALRGWSAPGGLSLTVLVVVIGTVLWGRQKLERRLEDAREIEGVVIGGVQVDRWQLRWTKLAGLSVPLFRKKSEVVMLRHDGKEHILTFAPTRSGKGVGLILPTLLTWKESMICTDIKGELWELTSGWRKAAGNVCLRFEPSRPSVLDEHGRRTVARWNPVDEVRIRPRFTREAVGTARRTGKRGNGEPIWSDSSGEIEVLRDADGFMVWDDDKGVGDAQNLAMLVADPQGKGLEDHWAKTSFALLVGMIQHVIYMWQSGMSDRTASLRTIDDLLSGAEGDLRDLWAKMILGGSEPSKGINGYYRSDGAVVDPRDRQEAEKVKALAQKTGRPAPEKPLMQHRGCGHPAIRSAAQDMIDRPENEGGSVVSTAKSYLALYRDPIVGENTSTSDFSVLDLMYYDQPVSLYLILPPSDKDRMMPLIRILLNACMRNLVELRPQLRPGDAEALPPGRQQKHRLLGMLDEFPSVGKLPIIQESLAYVAGYGIKMYLVTQDLAQIQDRYGKEESITSNCHIQNAYNPLRNETAEYLSKRCGESTYIQDKKSSSGTVGKVSGRSTSDSVNEVKRSLLTPDEVMTMPGPIKDSKGMIAKPGKMLVMIAGMPVIYGTQSLFFLFPQLLQRYEMPALEFTDSTSSSGRGGS